MIEYERHAQRLSDLTRPRFIHLLKKDDVGAVQVRVGRQDESRAVVQAVPASKVAVINIRKLVLGSYYRYVFVAASPSSPALASCNVVLIPLGSASHIFQPAFGECRAGSVWVTSRWKVVKGHV